MPSDPSTKYDPPEEEPIPDEEIPGPGEEEPIPASDLVGIAKWSTALTDDEEAAVVFSGENVGHGRMSAGLAATLLQAIAGFVKPITGLAPDVTGLTALASTAFHFGAAYGEQTQMTEAGTVSSPLRDAFEKLIRLIELSEDDDALLAEARETPAYSASNYVHLLTAISANQLKTTVVLREKAASVSLSPHRAAVAKTVLEREAPERYEDREVAGNLYEANAKKHGFELEEQETATKYEGTYLPEIEETIGRAWNKIVRVELRLKWTRLERAKTEKLASVTLLAVLEVVGDQPLDPLV